MMLRLPTPALAFGSYPQKDIEPNADMLRSVWWRTLASLCSAQQAAPLPRQLAHAYRTARHGLAPCVQLSEGQQRLDALNAATAQVRSSLAREGLTETSAGQALALAATALHISHGLQAYDTQVLAAWLMLRGSLVEMATGEGKTVAAGLAAAVAGLAGTPVHVLTANDYLVQRDSTHMAPFYAALGLSCAGVVTKLAGEQRQQAWQAQVVYSTASQLAFDYLRDHLQLRGDRDARVQRAAAMAADSGQATAAGPLLPGLCFCLVDEADSLLLDEAVVPLLLAGPAVALDVAAYQRAFALSSRLQRERDYQLHPAQRRAALTDAGRQRITTAVADASGDLYPARRACELVEAALVARLLVRRDREYAVANHELQLIDELTGRIAQGRQWQGALHPMVQIKEGLAPSPPTSPMAQMTYQRFFPRYLHLAGMSGTLLEARHELRQLYGCPVLRVPLAKTPRRRWLGQRCFASAADKWPAVVQAAALYAKAGRAVLVGTDSVAASNHLSALLHQAGLPHQLLNATQDQAEAEQIAAAGHSGCITIATNMAGRGTDIRLHPTTLEAGGLHVILTMKNRSRRIDRQLMGRAARHGDPGSAQSLLSLDDPLLQHQLPAALLRPLVAAALRLAQQGAHKTVAPWMAKALFSASQRLAEARDRQHRRELRHGDEDAALLYDFSGGTE